MSGGEDERVAREIINELVRRFGSYGASPLVSPFSSEPVSGWDPASRLLLAKFRVVRFLDVDGRLEVLRTWAESAGRVRLAVLRGRGGAGKTRLAAELLGELAGASQGDGASAWTVGFVRERVDPSGLLAAFESGRSVCVVVDYAEYRSPLVCGLIEQALLARIPAGARVRVVLTVRDESVSELWRLFSSEHPDADDVLSDALDLTVGAPSDWSMLWERSRDAFARLRAGAGLAITSNDGVRAAAGSALEVAADALMSVCEARESGDASDALARVLGHERKFWRLGVPLGDAANGALLDRVVALSTVASGPNVGEDDIAGALAQLKELDTDPGRRSSLSRWFLGLYGSEGLGPDRMFELLVDETVRAYPPLGALLLDPASPVVVSVLRVLARLSGESVPSWLTDGFGGVVGGFVDRVVDDPVAREGVEPLATLVANLQKSLGNTYREAVLSAAERIGGKNVVGLQVALIDVVTSGLSFVGEVPEDGGHMYWRTYRLLRSANDVSEAGHRFGELITVREAIVRLDHIVLGPGHPDTLTSRSNLARSYSSVGRYEETIVLDEQTLTDRVRVLGPDHPDTLTSRNNLASSFRSVGRYEDAIVLFEQTLTDSLRVLGPDHPDTLTSRSNLAFSFRSVGRYEDAIVLDEQTLTDRVRVLGRDHPDTLTSRNNLGGSYSSVGRHQDAIALFEQTLTDSLRVLGRDHPDTLGSRNNLALSYWSVGRYDDAIVLFEQTLTDSLRVLGPDHPDTLASRNNLAGSFRSVGLYEDAIVLFEQTLTDRLRVLGPDHPDTLTSRSNLALSYWSVGRYDDATVLLEQTLADRLRVLGRDHPDTLTSRNNLATAYRTVGRTADADRLASSEWNK